MKQNSEYRAEARQALSGKWSVSALMTFIFVLITGAVSSMVTLPFGNLVAHSTTGSLVGTILILPMVWGFNVAFLRLLRGEELELEMLFCGYSKKNIWITMLLKYVYILLWSLLLIIPGVIKSYSYAMTEYLMQDNPELKENAAIEESMKMMQGKKWNLFLLDLSFIGWIILAMLTFGIGMFWVEPYMQTARAAFYEEVKADYYAQ